MKISFFFERLFNIQHKIETRYKKTNNQWWCDPKEKYLVADLSAKTHLDIAIISWVVSSIGCITSVLLFLIEYKHSSFFALVGGILFGIIGSILMNLSKKQKNVFIKEKEIYDSSFSNKLNTDKKLVYTFKNSEKNILNRITAELNKNKNNQIIDFNSLNNLVDDLIVSIHDTEEMLSETYRSNKVYDYNVNEPLEIESFSYVDSYKKYDELSIHLNVLLQRLFEAKRYLQTNESSKLFYVLESILFLETNMNVEFDS